MIRDKLPSSALLMQLQSTCQNAPRRKVLKYLCIGVSSQQVVFRQICINYRMFECIVMTVIFHCKKMPVLREILCIICRIMTEYCTVTLLLLYIIYSVAH